MNSTYIFVFAENKNNVLQCVTDTCDVFRSSPPQSFYDLDSCTFPLRAPVLTFSHEIIDNREGVKQKKVKAEGKKKSFTGK